MGDQTRKAELAYQDNHGAWVHCGDYESEEAAIAASKQWAAGDAVYHDDCGTSVFGISTDPGSGHYEKRVEVYEDGTHTVQ